MPLTKQKLGEILDDAGVQGEARKKVEDGITRHAAQDEERPRLKPWRYPSPRKA